MNIRKYIYALGIVALSALSLASCSEDTEPTNFAPTLTCGDATNISRIGATVSGTISNTNVKEYGIRYGKSNTLAVEDGAKDIKASGSNFSVVLTGLTKSTTYYYKIYANSGVNYAFSAETKSFTTDSDGTPSFNPTQKVDSTASTIKIKTSLNDYGNDDKNIMIGGFWYKEVANRNDKTLNDKDDTKKLVQVLDFDNFTATLTDLKSDQLYAIRPFAYGPNLGMGEIMYVKTAFIATPTVSAVEPVVSDGSLSFTSRVLSPGTSTVTERGFVYSSENSTPTLQNKKIVATGGNDSFTANVTDLKAGERYYIRAYATNATGTGYGEVYDYEVPETVIVKPEIQFVSVDSITETSATIIAQVLSDGGGTISECAITVNNQTKVCDLLENGIFMYEVTGLLQDTEYIFEISATNEKGITRIQNLKFRTQKHEESSINKGEFQPEENWAKRRKN